MTSKLNFARVIFMLLTVSLLTTNCKDMKLDIQDSKDRLDVLEGTTITSINEQIVAINTSISDLKEMDAALDGYIKTLEATAADLQEQINEANAEIAKVESELGVEISALEQSLLNELNTAKEAIEAELTAINATLVELKAADAALDKKIEDLQTYVESQLASTTNWANATFSTLTQYAETQTEIATIKASIEQTNASLAALETRLNGKIADDIKTAIDALRSELNADYVSKIENAVTSVTSAYNSAISSAKEELTAAYKVAIATAIAESEAGMKAWVNEQLTQSYYDIATLDGMLSALSFRLDEADSDLLDHINEQKQALIQAKVDLTNEYKQCINQAIVAGGVIDQAISAQVKAAQDNLQSQIDVINGEIDSLKDRLGKLEVDFVNRIQSLKFIPEYSNRVALMLDKSKSLTLDFLVTPISQAEVLAAKWESDKTIIDGYLRYTKPALTKAVAPAVPLLINSVSSYETGLLSVTLCENPSYPLCEEFLSGNCSAVAYIRVSDGNTEMLSDIVDVEIYVVPTIDLSLSETANSYIVSKSGLYQFAPTKGNSSEPVGAIAYAEVLWESFGTDVVPNVGDLVTNVKYENGAIVFDTPSDYKEGNAVIAAKDEEGTILWSWHIWLTDEPQGQMYYNNAGTMMDRNLGATSATPGDVGALGLLYQWGRKDPFLGSSSISSSTLAKSTITWPSLVKSDTNNGTKSYATANPTTFITYNSSNSDWYYTGSSSTDNTRWTTSESKKSIYDPCPAGWRVPDGGGNGVWSKAKGSSSNFSHTYNSSNEGMNFSGKFGADQTIWYPASGYRSTNGGGLGGVGGGGRYWSASPRSNDDSSAYYLFLSYDGGGSPLYCDGRAHGFSVRCLQESK